MTGVSFSTIGQKIFGGIEFQPHPVFFANVTFFLQLPPWLHYLDFEKKFDLKQLE